MYMTNEQIDEMRKDLRISRGNNEKATSINGHCTNHYECQYGKCQGEKCKCFYCSTELSRKAA